jgi:hypothetical protein
MTSYDFATRWDELKMYKSLLSLAILEGLYLRLFLLYHPVYLTLRFVVHSLIESLFYYRFC